MVVEIMKPRAHTQRETPPYMLAFRGIIIGTIRYLGFQKKSPPFLNFSLITFLINLINYPFYIFQCPRVAQNIDPI